MSQIICQLGTKKLNYLHQNDYNKLLNCIKTDFMQLKTQFELMYVDEQNGDWMITQNQRDFDIILKLRKSTINFKIVPASPNKDQQCESKVRKMIITQEMKKLVQFVSQKYMQKYITAQQIDKMLLQTEKMIESKLSQTKIGIDTINPQIQKRMKMAKPSRRIERISPIKKQNLSLQEQVNKAVASKLNKIMPNIIQQTYKYCMQNISCKSCLKKQLQLQKLINKTLMRKSRRKILNPQE